MLIQKPRIPFRDIFLFGLFPSFLKVRIYRLLGYKIGKHVSIGFLSVICAKKVDIGHDTRIGFLTIIRGKNIKIGNHVKIGSITFLDTPNIEIGNGTRVNEQVFVGGLQYPNSKFSVGQNCLIQQYSFINPAISISIGDNSAIGGYSLIFGHTSWHNQLEGYPVNFKPIEIGNHVGIAWRVFVLPGTKIGDGAQVGANSVISGNVPPRCLSLGFPARIVAKEPDFPRNLSEEDKVKIFKNIIKEMIDYFIQSDFQCQESGNDINITSNKRISFRKKIWRMRVFYRKTNSIDIPAPDDRINVFLSLGNISKNDRDILNKNKIMWIDIENKEQSEYSNHLGDEVTLFLNRFGIRTSRIE